MKARASRKPLIPKQSGVVRDIVFSFIGIIFPCFGTLMLHLFSTHAS